jgi:hypothetical protein
MENKKWNVRININAKTDINGTGKGGTAKIVMDGCYTLGDYLQDAVYSENADSYSFVEIGENNYAEVDEDGNKTGKEYITLSIESTNEPITPFNEIIFD